MNRRRNTVATAVVATILAALISTCESGMLQEIREASQAAEAASETQYYTVTYDGNGATSGEVPVDDARYEQGQTVTVLGNVGGLAKDGHNFAGWNTAADGHGTSYGAGAGFQMGTADVTLYARWTQLAVYEVSFNSQGGSPVPLQEVMHGGLVNEPVAPAREGYTFGGWFKEPGCVNEWDFSIDSVTAERELFAKWTANTYAIVFHANGGTGSMQNQEVNYDQSVSLTFNGFARTGYTFEGWATSEGGAVVYGDGVSYTHTITGKRNLYARWTLNSYSIFFHANGGTGSMENQPVDFNQTVTLTTNGFTRTGYTFDGWATSAGGSVAYANEASYKHTITSNRNLWARWKANSYDIIFHANGGTGSMENQPVDFNQTVTLTTNGFTRTGYTFAGWATSAGGSVVYGNGASYTHTITSNENLYARWTVNSYNIIFHANGGSGTMANQAVNYNQTVTLNTNSYSRLGYRFDGWATSGSWTPVVYLDGASYTHTTTTDRNLYAKWTEWHVGMTGPAGGIVFYDRGEYTGGLNGWRFLEAAPASTEVVRPWGGSGTEVWFTATGVGEGLNNTLNIAGTIGWNSAHAAGYCLYLVHNSFDDWFLASRDEMLHMWQQRGVIGGFHSAWYWNSSEYNADQARVRRFDSSGDQAFTSKSNNYRVRPIRRF